MTVNTSTKPKATARQKAEHLNPSLNYPGDPPLSTLDELHKVAARKKAEREARGNQDRQEQ